MVLLTVRRPERLLQLLTLLRNRRTAVTARQLADALQTSTRTVYRDIQSLVLSGVPVEGEAGIGYRLARNPDLPPLMFDEDELEALLLGVKVVRVWSDERMARSASRAMQKIMAVVPPGLREREASSFIHVPGFVASPELSAHGGLLRDAIEGRQVLCIRYTRADGTNQDRRIHPLGLFFWGNTWTVVAWCELRGDYRSFRLDRMTDPTPTGGVFETGEAKSLDHFLARTAEASSLR